jgi:hypothetical protein
LGLFKRVLEELEINKKLRENNQEIAIPFPFRKFSEWIPGIQRARYFGVSASSKIGKSKLTKQMFVYAPIEYILNTKTRLDIKILYFCLETNKEEEMKEIVCYILYKYYNVLISPDEISSVFKNKILTDDVLTILKSDRFNKLVAEFEKRIWFIDTVRTPSGINNVVTRYAHTVGYYYDKEGNKLSTELIESGNEEELQKVDRFKMHNPNLMVETIVDHVSLLVPERGLHNDLHDAMGDYSANHALKWRDRYGFTVVDVHQQAAASESLENFKLERLQPTANGLADNKTNGRNFDMLLGLFAPNRYKIAKYEGYDITKLRDNHRELSVIFNRRGPALTTQLYFRGAANFFDELPSPHLFNEKPELYNRFN